MFIQFSPDYSTWADWNGQMIHYFGDQPIPVLPEPKWAEVANAIITLPAFDVYSMPAPEAFQNWRDWARIFTQSINGNK